MSYESKEILNHADVETECRHLIEEKRNIILHGPPSCGKTTLIRKLISEYETDDLGVERLQGSDNGAMLTLGYSILYSVKQHNIYIIETDTPEQITRINQYKPVPIIFTIIEYK